MDTNSFMELISLFEITQNALQAGLLKAALFVLCNKLSPVGCDLAAVGVKYLSRGSSYLPIWYLKEVIRGQKIRESCSDGSRWQSRNCGSAPQEKLDMAQLCHREKFLLYQDVVVFTYELSNTTFCIARGGLYFLRENEKTLKSTDCTFCSI